MNLILKFNVIFNLINFKLRLIFNFKFKDTVKQLNKINLNIKKVKRYILQLLLLLKGKLN